MNLQPLFEQQKKTMEMYEEKHPTQPGENRFEKKILALLVEVGECANEWRGFKYWSKDQEPRIKVPVYCGCDNGSVFMSMEWGCEACEECKGTGILQIKNPLLEEYVDGLHFVLELGIELETKYFHPLSHNIKTHKYNDVNYQFIWINDTITKIFQYKDLDQYEQLVDEYIALGEMLGFTWEQIEQAYWNKNKINHQRQDSGVY